MATSTNHVKAKKYSALSSAFFHAEACFGWGMWIFNVGEINEKSITFSGGGQQEARGANGSPVSSCNHYFAFLDHVLEELDAPNEYFIDAARRTLYYYHNAGDELPPVVEASQTMMLLWINGVSNVTVRGLTFTQSSNSFSTPHETSAGGDWATTREGAVRVTNSHHSLIERNLFTHLGGNALVIDNKCNGTQVLYNEINNVGANGIVVIGAMVGYNATIEQTQPSNTLIKGNLIFEVGKYNKQSGAIYNTITYDTVITGNMMFNGPRTLLNLNDGFGGGHVVSYNIIFNSSRETHDVGPFNSWNRVPYYHISRMSGQGTWDTDLIYIHHNLVNNDNDGVKSAKCALNFDDGSTRYVVYNNVLTNSRTKCYQCEEIHYVNNVHVPQPNRECWGLQSTSNQVTVINNTCIRIHDLGSNLEGSRGGWGSFQETCYVREDFFEKDLSVNDNNTYYLPVGSSLAAGFTSCGDQMRSLSEWQDFAKKYPAFETRFEPHSTVNILPTKYPYYRHLGTDLLGITDHACSR